MKMYAKYPSFLGNKVYVFPARGWLAHLKNFLGVRKYARFVGLRNCVNSHGDHETGPVPTDIAKGAKLFRDAGNCSGNEIEVLRKACQ